MASPVPRFRAGLESSNNRIRLRADAHAALIAAAVRLEFLGSGEVEANEDFWLRPDRITLTLLTKLLIDRGYRSALNTPLTSTAVDRACARSGFDWRAWRLRLIDNRVALGEAGNMASEVAPNQTSQFRQTKIRRRNEYHEALRRDALKSSAKRGRNR
jgi:hypothetical protein